MKNVLETDFLKGFTDVCDICYRNGWNERNGGNMSYRLKPEEVDEVRDCLSFDKPWSPIGVTVNNLKNEFFMVTGSGKYFRNTKADPENNVSLIQIDEKGENFRVVWGLKNGGRPTSELPTHLLNHSVKKEATNGKFRIILHAHPANIIALTYVLPLDSNVFTRELWEMMTECAIVFPHGVGVLPWMVPGGSEIAYKTAEMIKKYDIVIWAIHGLFCSGEDFDSTYGLMETVEKAAEILVKVMSMGGKKRHLSDDNIMSLAEPYDVDINGELLK